MVNKRVTPIDDPLVNAVFLIKQSQKRFLDDLGKSGRSAFIRKLIDIQMNLNPHAIETDRLEEENRLLEAQLNINKAQINEYKAEVMKQQVVSHTREQLLDQTTERLIKCNPDIDFKDHGFSRIFKNNLDDMNRIIGSNGEPIQYEEFKKLTIKKAEARGVYINE